MDHASSTFQQTFKAGDVVTIVEGGRYIETIFDGCEIIYDQTIKYIYIDTCEFRGASPERFANQIMQECGAIILPLGSKD